MRTVKVTILSDDRRDQSAVPCFIERDRGAGYVREGGGDMVVNMGEKVFQLDVGQRLVIDTTNVAGEVAYDHAQSAAYRKPDQVSEVGIDSAKAHDPVLDRIAESEHANVKRAAERTGDPQLKALAEKGPVKSHEAPGVPQSTPVRTPTGAPTSGAISQATNRPPTPKEKEASDAASAQRSAAGAVQAKNEPAHSPDGVDLSGAKSPGKP